MHKLISFLGKHQQRNDKGQMKERYRTATYQFKGEHGTSEYTARQFSLALLQEIKPEQLIILGTSGSMWDVFVEELGIEEQYLADWMELSEQAGASQVQQQHLQPFESLLSERLAIPVKLRLIPFGRDQTEQLQILHEIAQEVEHKDQVSMDLTHGFRHLPMLAMMSAIYLRSARKVTINGIYYGALDMTENGLTPVMRLDGLLTLSDWNSAMYGFDRYGDYAPFAELLQQEGVDDEATSSLNKAAFHEGIMDIPQARKPLANFRKLTANGLPGVGALFNKTLRERTAWCEEGRLYQRQRSRAHFYLQQRDYVRAAAMGFEGFITRELQHQPGHIDPSNYNERQKIKETIEKRRPQNIWEDYKFLRGLRNSLAHGNRATQAKIQQAFSNEEQLHKSLLELFNRLIPE